MSSFEECPDGHRCENGSKCSENPYDEGGYYCDCDEAIFNDAVAGLYCEHSATSYCTFNEEISRVSFCTNNGECRAEVSPESAHLGCDCPDNYEGEHCQFTKGKKPKAWPFDGSDKPDDPYNYSFTSTGGGNEGMSGGVIAVIVLVVLAVVGGAVFFVVRKRRSHPLVVTDAAQFGSDLELDADGGVLRDAMQDGGDVNGVSSTAADEAVLGRMTSIPLTLTDSEEEHMNGSPTSPTNGDSSGAPMEDIAITNSGDEEADDAPSTEII